MKKAPQCHDLCAYSQESLGECPRGKCQLAEKRDLELVEGRLPPRVIWPPNASTILPCSDSSVGESGQEKKR